MGTEAESNGWAAGDDRIELRAQIESGLRGQRVTVLASGDPMLFGIGATLAGRIPPDEMTVLDESLDAWLKAKRSA